MELDNIKKLWDEVNLLKEKQQFNDERIKEMLKSKQKTALSKLKRLSIIGIVVIVPVAYLFYLQVCDIFEPGILRAFFVSGLFLTVAVSISIETYSFRLLKGIDYSRITIRNAYEKILNYEHLVKKGKLYGTVWFVAYIGSYAFFTYKVGYGTELVWGIIIPVAIIFFGGWFLIHLLYKKLYYKRINQIKESLKELEEFEQS